ncbi:MAG: hypothetical protein B7Y69_09390 [Sphingobacteriia bacterium 35-40-8]|nr:MAG: hypothetical protein B7Y69_09390 [Sphingobacteriia bacterium 35-40-8]
MAIIDMTLTAVAITDKRMIKRANDRCLVNAIRFAIKKARLSFRGFVKTTPSASMQQMLL